MHREVTEKIILPLLRKMPFLYSGSNVGLQTIYLHSGFNGLTVFLQSVHAESEIISKVW
jgi:hypothetical protein